MFKTTDITCPSCDNTKGFYHSDNLADCTSCNTAVHVDTPTYHTYNVTPLQEIAKQQALEDIHQAIHLELWLEEQSPIGINWANCFDTNNIEQIRVA